MGIKGYSTDRCYKQSYITQWRQFQFTWTFLGRIAWMQCVMHKMQPIATVVACSVVCVCVSVCVLVTRICCAKTAESIEMPFEVLTHVGPRNQYYMGVKMRRIHSQTRELTRRRCGLICQITLDSGWSYGKNRLICFARTPTSHEQLCVSAESKTNAIKRPTFTPKHVGQVLVVTWSYNYAHQPCLTYCRCQSSFTQSAVSAYTAGTCERC